MNENIQLLFMSLTQHRKKVKCKETIYVINGEACGRLIDFKMCIVERAYIELYSECIRLITHV